MNGSEQCNTLRRLERALSRAAAAPLDIVVNLKTKPDMHPKKEKRASELLRTLVRTSSRWASLNIKGLSMHDFDFTCLEKDYGSLVSLVMTETTRLIQAIDRSAPNLTTLEANRLQINNFAALSWWPRLTTLSYVAHFRDDNPADRIRILECITRCTQLHKLTLSMNGIRFTADEIALYISRSLPNLRKLYFINVNCAMLFECPNLTHLSYKINTPRVAITTTVVLKHLVYCEVESTFVGDLLAPLVAPNLRCLRIKTKGLDRAFQRWWEERSGKSVLTTLHLEEISLTTGMLKTTLETMEGLKRLRLRDVQVVETAFKKLEIKPKGRKGSILCPRLVTLDVDSTELARLGDLERILKEVAESRRIAGVPLKSLTYRSLEGTLDLCQR